MELRKRKNYKLRTYPLSWIALTLLTVGLAVAVMLGAPISPWWILAPLGIPIALIIGVPLYAILAIIALFIIGLALLAIGILPCLLLVLVLGVVED